MKNSSRRNSKRLAALVLSLCLCLGTFGTTVSAKAVSTTSGTTASTSSSVYPTNYFTASVKGSTGWAGTKVSVYQSNSTSSRVIYTMSRGTVFVITKAETTSNFWKVKLEGGLEGYVQWKYCMINLPDVLPEIEYSIVNASSAIYKSSGYSISGITGTQLYSTGKVQNNKIGRKEYLVPVMFKTACKIFRLANITLRDYIISDYAMKRWFAFSEKELLGLPDKIIEQYLSQARPLAGMVRKPEPVTAKKYDNRYPAEIVPWHCPEYEDVKTPADAIFAVRELIQDSDREILGVINLDGWRPLNFHLSAIGSSNTTAVDSGLLLRATLLSNANAVILFHNHPSGDIEPSNADRMMTEKMRCLCGKCGITLMDHVIIGFHNDFCFSFYRNSIFDAEHRESPFQSTAEYIRESLLKERGKGAISGDMESGNIAAEKTVQTIAINKRLPRR